MQITSNWFQILVFVIIQVITCRLTRFRFIWMNGLEILAFEVRYFPFNFMGKSVDNFQLELFSRAAIIRQMHQVELFSFGSDSCFAIVHTKSD